MHSSSGSFYFLSQRHKCHPQHPNLECCLCSVPASIYVFMKFDIVFLFAWDESRQGVSHWRTGTIVNMCVLLLSRFVFWLTKVFAFAGTLDVVFGEIDR
jgi:hypothetical protein